MKMEIINKTKNRVSLLACLKFRDTHIPLFKIKKSPKLNYVFVTNNKTKYVNHIHRDDIPKLIEKNKQYLTVKLKFI